MPPIDAPPAAPPARARAMVWPCAAADPRKCAFSCRSRLISRCSASISRRASPPRAPSESVGPFPFPAHSAAGAECIPTSGGRSPCITTAAMEARFCIRSARISSSDTPPSGAGPRAADPIVLCFAGEKICAALVLRRRAPGGRMDLIMQAQSREHPNEDGTCVSNGAILIPRNPAGRDLGKVEHWGGRLRAGSQKGRQEQLCSAGPRRFPPTLLNRRMFLHRAAYLPPATPAQLAEGRGKT